MSMQCLKKTVTAANVPLHYRNRAGSYVFDYKNCLANFAFGQMHFQ